MKVAIAGGHGQIGRRLARLLAASGDSVRSLIRSEEQAGELRGDGVEPVVCDLERASAEEVASAVGAVDAVVFAAGAGPGSGAERKETMDYGGAVKLIAAAQRNGVDRYAMVSSMGADPDAQGDDTFAVYLRAKGRADAELAASGLGYTIVRPGMLTDDPGGGAVTVGDDVGRSKVPRDDVAAVLAAVLREPRTAGLTFEVVAGDEPIEAAIASLVANHG